MRHRLLAYAGLARPYRFERTLVVLTALLLVLVVGAFGLGTAYLYKVRLLDQTVFPGVEEAEHRFRWHPLLQGVPIPSDGDDIHHNTFGQRGRERTPQSLDGKATIALFGGSTTYDVGGGEGETWGDRLEELLGADRFAVINHGMLGYSTAEHVIQTAFYERTHGVPPRCAIYYVGWNDLRNSHVRNLDPGYADFHLPGQIDNLEVRRLRQSYVSFSPLLMLVRHFLVLGVDTARAAGRHSSQIDSAPDPAMEEIFRRNVRTISAINHQRGIKTLWMGQVMNHRRLLAGDLWGWVPFLHAQDVSTLMLRLNDLLKHEAEALGDIYVDIAPQAFASDDFIDDGHFTPDGSRKFAERLAPAVASACR